MSTDYIEFELFKAMFPERNYAHIIATLQCFMNRFNIETAVEHEVTTDGMSQCTYKIKHGEFSLSITKTSRSARHARELVAIGMVDALRKDDCKLLLELNVAMNQ